MERVQLFLSQIVILFFVGLATWLYWRLMFNRFRKKLDDQKWCKSNKWKFTLTVSIPRLVLFSPSWEEIVFRAPLIIKFSGLSLPAWKWLFVSNIFFWLGHLIFQAYNYSLLPKKISVGDINIEISPEAVKEGRKRFVKFTIVKFFSSMAMGVIAGYYGIKYQSIWIAFWIHLTWNLFPALLLLVHHIKNRTSCTN